jgi:outer membrane protein assembly factor BamB
MRALKRLRDFRNWCPKPSAPLSLSSKIKRYSMPIAAMLTATLIFSVSFFGFSSSAIPIVPLVNEQSRIENFATGIAAADGKVFTIDNWGIVDCFNAQTGKEVWSTTTGGYTAMPQSIAVYNGAVYAATRGGVVVSVDEKSGKVLLQFQAPVSSSIGEKTTPNAFSVGDGCVFVGSDGFAAFNASTGNLLWEWPSASIRAYGTHDVPLASMVWPFEDNVFVAQGGVGSFYRINPENASVLWYAPGYSSSPPLYSQGQVILWNEGATSQGQTVVSVNASTGSILWNYNVGSSIYPPIVSAGLLLFAGSNGNFYALYMTNGTLAWKTPVDPQNYMTKYNSDQLIVSSVKVDNQTQEMFWGFMVVKSELTAQYGSEQYVGTLSGMSATDGQITWSRQVSYSGYISPYLTSYPNATLGLAVGNHTLYLTASSNPNYITPGGNLWRIDESTGTILGTAHFDHYVLPPVETDNNVAIAADLEMLLLTDSSSSITLQIAIALTVVVIVVALVVVLVLKKKLKSKGE